MASLLNLFNHLGQKSEGQLEWADKDKAWTQWMFQCFDDYVIATHSVEGISNYMDIDRVWRDVNLGYIILALEHENNFVRKDFLSQEIQHLIDLKALDKMAITYPQLGEEEETINEIRSLIGRNALLRVAEPWKEEYLIVFGFTTKKEGKPAILWKGYTIDNVGKLMRTDTRVVLQARS